ncbi:hypothetical protein JCM8547_003590 [Rhodosporidiobolus lusitaniae]
MGSDSGVGNKPLPFPPITVAPVPPRLRPLPVNPHLCAANNYNVWCTQMRRLVGHEANSVMEGKLKRPTGQGRRMRRAGTAARMFQSVPEGAALSVTGADHLASHELLKVETNLLPLPLRLAALHFRLALCAHSSAPSHILHAPIRLALPERTRKHKPRLQLALDSARQPSLPASF